MDEFAEPVQILPPTHSVYVKSTEAERIPKTTIKKSLIALGHVWRADQSVVVTTNQESLLLYSPLKNTCKLLSVSPLSKKLKRKYSKDGDDDGSSDEDSESESDKEDDDISHSDDTSASESALFQNVAVPVECLIYSKDLLIAGGKVYLSFRNSCKGLPHHRYQDRCSCSIYSTSTTTSRISKNIRRDRYIANPKYYPVSYIFSKV